MCQPSMYEKGFTKRRSARTNREIIYIDSTDSRDNISNVIFSQNKIQFSVNLNKDTIIVLNQNAVKHGALVTGATNNYQGKSQFIYQLVAMRMYFFILA